MASSHRGSTWHLSCSFYNRSNGLPSQASEKLPRAKTSLPTSQPVHPPPTPPHSWTLVIIPPPSVCVCIELKLCFIRDVSESQSNTGQSAQLGDFCPKTSLLRDLLLVSLILVFRKFLKDLETHDVILFSLCAHSHCPHAAHLSSQGLLAQASVGDGKGHRPTHHRQPCFPPPDPRAGLIPFWICPL